MFTTSSLVAAFLERLRINALLIILFYTYPQLAKRL